ncbi:hypothetical protein BD410DRAFT_579193 [Rickenella mellea]|uniref:Uncharacterized protein n=1 Tax=Rickenella mellea TaxID=50990 RepID=A0A4Y7PRK8_9AGAM|nr:hypothetical protein BD410DRAFT_579193 [Rickenella mellea]
MQFQRVSFFFVAFVAFILCALAAPVPADDDSLEKRITHSGRGTWYDTGLGACGKWNNSWEMVVAISHLRWNGGGNCGQYMQINWGGKSQYAKVVDECMGCADGDLDMSASLFSHFASQSKGVLNGVSWHFMAKGWHP